MKKINFTLYKAIILVIALIVVVLISSFSYYLYKIDKSYNASFNETSAKVIEETDLTEISKKYTSQEKELYHIYIGENNSKEEMIASVHLPKDAKEISSKDIKTYKSTDLISEESILNQWEQTCNKCELIKIKPAIIDKELLWEITYNDADNRYVFDSYLMADGTEYEKFKLKRNFN